MNRKSILAGALLLAGSLVASQAEAYTYITCGDVKVVWSHPFQMVQNTYSIPSGGKREGAVDKSLARWKNVIGMEDMVSKSSSVTTGGSIAQFNFQNDVAVVKSSAIGGAAGLTLMISDGCFFGGDMEWIEADVMAASYLDFGKVPESSVPSSSGLLTFLHEFGHAQGLQHVQGFNLMRFALPLPIVGGPGETADVLPDDAAGGRFLYPTGNKEVNLFATALRRTSGDQIVLNNSGTLTFCSSGGGTFAVNATVGNNGTVDVKQTERWWVSTSQTAHSGGTQVLQWNNSTFLANKVKTRSVNITLPALAPGTYFLYHGVDALHEVDESREDDNAVREALVLKIVSC